MRTMTQMQALDKLSDNDMAKRIILTILNTPKPDYEAMRQQSKEYEAELFAEMSESGKIIGEIFSLSMTTVNIQ